MIKPSIGRVVWFQPAHVAAAKDLPQPFAALIAYVHHDRCINVGGFDSGGMHYAATSVPLLQDDDPIPEHGYYARWMPFQVGQAARVSEPALKA
jgi:hypothetical protein